MFSINWFIFTVSNQLAEYTWSCFQKSGPNLSIFLTLHMFLGVSFWGLCFKNKDPRGSHQQIKNTVWIIKVNNRLLIQNKRLNTDKIENLFSLDIHMPSCVRQNNWCFWQVFHTCKFGKWTCQSNMGPTIIRATRQPRYASMHARYHRSWYGYTKRKVKTSTC